MKHDDSPKSTIGVLLNDVEAHQYRCAASVNDVPRVTSDPFELIDATRPDDSAAEDLFLEPGHEIGETIVSAEAPILVDQLDVAGQATINEGPSCDAVGLVPGIEVGIHALGHPVGPLLAPHFGWKTSRFKQGARIAGMEY